MILTCPNCQTRFLVADQAIGADGRRVRCGNCQHMWFAEPDRPPGDGPDAVPDELPEEMSDEMSDRPVEDTAPADEDIAAPPPDADAETAVPDMAEDIAPEAAAADAPMDALTDAPTDDGAHDMAAADPPDQPEPELAAPARPASEGTIRRNLPALPRQGRGIAAGWIALGVFVVALIAGVLGFKDGLIKAWPPSVGLYRALGMVAPAPPPASVEAEPASFVRIVDKTYEVQPRDQGVVLAISARIENGGDRPVELPTVRGVLLDNAQNEIRDWRIQPGVVILGPGETVTVQSEIVDPPPDATAFDLFLMWAGPQGRPPADPPR